MIQSARPDTQLNPPNREVEVRTPSPHEVTGLLDAWSQGDKAALDKLTPLVYEDLRRRAHGYMKRQSPDHTLQTTALVNEAYFKLVSQDHPPHWRNRAHFFAVAAQAMRQILVDYARRKHYAKRGGDARKVTLDEAAIVSQERAAEVIALDEALSDLAKVFPEKCKVVELRYFGGLSIEETAAVLKIAPITVRRHWKSARFWLYDALNNKK